MSRAFMELDAEKLAEVREVLAKFWEHGSDFGSNLASAVQDLLDSASATYVEHDYERIEDRAAWVAHQESHHGGFLPHYSAEVRDELADDPGHRLNMHAMQHAIPEGQE